MGEEGFLKIPDFVNCKFGQPAVMNGTVFVSKIFVGL